MDCKVLSEKKKKEKKKKNDAMLRTSCTINQKTSLQTAW